MASGSASLREAKAQTNAEIEALEKRLAELKSDQALRDAAEDEEEEEEFEEEEESEEEGHVHESTEPGTEHSFQHSSGYPSKAEIDQAVWHFGRWAGLHWQELHGLFERHSFDAQGSRRHGTPSTRSSFSPMSPGFQSPSTQRTSFTPSPVGSAFTLSPTSPSINIALDPGSTTSTQFPPSEQSPNALVLGKDGTVATKRAWLTQSSPAQRISFAPESPKNRHSMPPSVGESPVSEGFASPSFKRGSQMSTSAGTLAGTSVDISSVAGSRQRSSKLLAVHTPGSRRPSSVAGAGASGGAASNRSQSKLSPDAQFMYSLREEPSPQKSKRESKRASAIKEAAPRVVTQEEFLSTVQQLGFHGDAQIVFDEIRSEGMSAAGTITQLQFQSFERRSDVVMASLAELLSLKRGAVLRAWRLDVDMQATGTATKQDFLSLCTSLGLQDRGKRVWAQLRPGRTIDPLYFSQIEPEECKNAEDFTEILMSEVDWDPEAAWDLFERDLDGAVNFAQFQACTRELGFRGRTRLLFEGLDISNKGRFWREDFDYLLVLVRSTLRSKQGEVLDLQLPSGGLGDFSTAPWEPSEHDRLAKDFCVWASQGMNWHAIYQLFSHEEKLTSTTDGVPMVELQRWLHMLGWYGDITGLFYEISRERPRSGYYDERCVGLDQLEAFRKRRYKIAIEEFLELLHWRRSSGLRAWKLDLDRNGSGLIEKPDFLRGARHVGGGDGVSLVWDGAHFFNGTSDTTPISFKDLCPEEMGNLSTFADALLPVLNWNIEDTFDFIAVNGVIFSRQFLDCAEAINFEGDAELLFSGLVGVPGNPIMIDDIDYMWTLVFTHMRLTWSHPPCHTLSSSAQATLGGAFNLLEKLGLDSRGVDRNGEALTMSRLCSSLGKIGFSGSNLRSAAELVWKIISGLDVDLHISAKNLFKQPPGAAQPPRSPAKSTAEKPPWDESRVPWYNLKFQRLYGIRGKKWVCDVDVKQERRCRLIEFHRNIERRRAAHSARGRDS